MRVADLFCGCGGFSLGFQEAGFEIVRAIDNWQPAINVYNANHSFDAISQDLADVASTIFTLRGDKPDVIVGGPPCQDFSIAGERKRGARAMLTAEFAETIYGVEPRWFVMENVDTVKKSPEYQAARRVFKNAGYGITEISIDVSLYGVPQKRKRFFSIGREGVEDNFLFDDLTERQTEDRLTVRQYLGDEFGIEHYYRHPRTWGRRGVFSIDEPAPTVRTTNRPVPKGYKPHPNDPVSADTVRSLYPRERGRVQTFPNWYKFEGVASHLDTMVANAVPVQAASIIAKAILEFEETYGSVVMDSKRFLLWLMGEAGIGKKSASDVLSRLRRVSAMLGTLDFNSADEAIFKLDHNAEFKTLTTSVKSQMRRAVHFYFAYENGEAPPSRQQRAS